MMESEGWIEASSQMPEVVDGPLESPPLTAPTMRPEIQAALEHCLEKYAEVFEKLKDM